MSSALAIASEREQQNQSQDEPAVAIQPCVLLAEDDREMRMLLAAALRQAGYDVVEALDGVDLLDCIAWVVERRSDWSEAILVSDVRMPAMGGLEVVARLRSMGWPGPIILITAFGDDATHDLARRLGASRVLDKPFDLDVLCDAIRQVRSS
jgi:CheY-like chemotaxis protein